MTPARMPAIGATTLSPQLRKSMASLRMSTQVQSQREDDRSTDAWVFQTAEGQQSSKMTEGRGFA